MKREYRRSQQKPYTAKQRRMIAWARRLKPFAGHSDAIMTISINKETAIMPDEHLDVRLTNLEQLVDMQNERIKVVTNFLNTDIAILYERLDKLENTIIVLANKKKE